MVCLAPQDTVVVFDTKIVNLGETINMALLSTIAV